MKNLILTGIIILISFHLFAQTETKPDNEGFKTLFDKIEAYGGYGAFSMNYSELKLADEVYRGSMAFGGKGEWIANHCLGIGMGGYGIVSGSFYSPYYFNKIMFTAGYGGIIIDPIIFPKKVIHFAFPVFIGGGGAAIHENYKTYNHNNGNNMSMLDHDQFFVIEPGIEAEVNLFRYVRLAFGAYYRYTTDIDLLGINKSALKGFSAGITFKIGVF